MKATVDPTIRTFAHFTPGLCPRMHPNTYASNYPFSRASVGSNWSFCFAYSFASKPWYRAESTGLGYYWNKFLISTGFYTDMPGPPYVSFFILHSLISSDSIDPSDSLKSAGYRLEEMVRCSSLSIHARDSHFWGLTIGTFQIWEE